MALERLELLITSTGAAAARDIRSVGTAAEGAAAKQTLLQRATTGAGRAVNTLSGGLVPAEAGLKGAAVAAGALAGVGLAKFVGDSVSSFVSLASEVRNFQRASRATAEESSRFVAVLDDMEIASDKGSKGIFKLGVEASTGGTKLAQFGIEIAKNKDGTTNLTETLLNVSDAYVATGDAGEKAGIAAAAFGTRAARDLIPILEQGRKGLADFFSEAEKHGQILTDDDIAQARKYELAIDDLQDTMRGFQLAVGKVALPIFTAAIEGTTQTINTLDASLQATGLSLGTVGTAVGGTLSSFNAISNATHAWSAGSELLAGNFGDAALEFGKAIPVVNQVVGIFDSGSEASNKFGEAQTKLTESQRTAANLALDGKKNTQEYRDAMADAREASDTLYGAQKNLADAMQDTATKTSLATDAMLLQLGAAVSLQGSVLAVQDAIDKKKKTEEDAANAAAVGIDNSREVAKANLAVQQSILQVVDVAGKKAVADNIGASEAVKAAAKTEAQANAIAYLRDTVPGASEQLDILGVKVRTLPDGKHIIVTAEDHASSVIGNIGNAIARLFNPTVGITASRRQAGGPVSAGRAYIVGEAGPEMFIPSTSGSIVPNHGMTGGTNLSVTVHVGGSVISEHDLVNHIHAGLLEKQRAGRLGLS